MSRLVVPRWAFHVLLAAGLLVQVAATHPLTQAHTPRAIAWLGGVLTFNVPPYMTLFFWRFALGDWRAAYVGVFVTALAMALAFQHFAPPRLGLRQVVLAFAAWIALALILILALLLAGR